MTEASLHFEELVEPTRKIAEIFHRWENDPELIPFTRPNRSRQELDERNLVTVGTLRERIKQVKIYLIYRGDWLIGKLSFAVDPDYLYKKEPGTAWIGITIGEAEARGKGVGFKAMRYLEEQIAAAGLKRIELGVFEFNKPAIALYRKLGYREIGRIEEFTYWQGRMWQDIRMEKYLASSDFEGQTDQKLDRSED